MFAAYELHTEKMSQVPTGCGRHGTENGLKLKFQGDLPIYMSNQGVQCRTSQQEADRIVSNNEPSHTHWCRKGWDKLFIFWKSIFSPAS